MPILEAGALIGLAKQGIELAWKWKSDRNRAEEASQEELRSAYEYGTRLSGSVLFELRANIERLRFVVQEDPERRFPLAPFDFAVSDAVMPRLCDVVAAPRVLGEFHLALSAVRRVDFFQRIAVQPRAPNPDAFSDFASAASVAAPPVAFARDALQKGIVERFNLLREVTAGMGKAAHGDAWAGVEDDFLPRPIDPGAPVDHSLI